MKKVFSVFLVILMIFTSLTACKGIAKKEDNADGEYIYLPKYKWHSQENSGGYHRESIYKYEYDDYGNVIKETEYTDGRIFNIRERTFDTTYNYDENGRILKEFVRTEDFCTSITDGHNVYTETFDYIYNEKQQLIKKQNISINGVEDTYCFYGYEYDEQGNVVKATEYNGDAEKNCEYGYTYDSQNKLIEKVKTFHFMGKASPYEETDFTYNEKGQIDYYKIRFYNSSDYYEVYCYYDELNRLVKEEKTRYDYTGNILDKYISKYKKFIKIKKEDSRRFQEKEVPVFGSMLMG